MLFNRTLGAAISNIGEDVLQGVCARHETV